MYIAAGSTGCAVQSRVTNYLFHNFFVKEPRVLFVKPLDQSFQPVVAEPDVLLVTYELSCLAPQEACKPQCSLRVVAGYASHAVLCPRYHCTAMQLLVIYHGILTQPDFVMLRQEHLLLSDICHTVLHMSHSATKFEHLPCRTAKSSKTSLLQQEGTST